MALDNMGLDPFRIFRNFVQQLVLSHPCFVSIVANLGHNSILALAQIHAQSSISLGFDGTIEKTS